MKTTQKARNGKVWGYARVSTTDQDLSVQEAALEAAGCIKVFSEKKSGTRRDGRTELEVLLECVREGDTVVATRLDRIARSNKDFQDIYAELAKRGVKLKFTEQPIMNSDGALGGLMINVLAAFAEFETQLRRERQMEGIQSAKAKGVYKGRKPSIDPAKVRELHAQGIGPAAIARKLEITRSSVYRLLGQSEGACAITTAGTAS